MSSEGLEVTKRQSTYVYFLYSHPLPPSFTMDYAKYDTVEAVLAFVDRQPLAVKKVLNAPWLTGSKAYHLDTDLVRQKLETISMASQTNTNTRNIPE
jgi:hypothetical protein